jgi:hypothetical protein
MISTISRVESNMHLTTIVHHDFTNLTAEPNMQLTTMVHHDFTNLTTKLNMHLTGEPHPFDYF